jgi:hypothetical protein
MSGETMAGSKLYLYTTEDCARFGEARGRGGDVEFPPGVHDWTDVLDCRHAPYTDKSLAENCEIAHHVRKHYILVGEEQISKETPTG